MFRPWCLAAVIVVALASSAKAMDRFVIFGALQGSSPAGPLRDAERIELDALNALSLDERVPPPWTQRAFFFSFTPIQTGLHGWEPTGFDRFQDQLARRAASFSRTIVVAQGDTHNFRIDKPFAGTAQMTRGESFGPPQRGAIIDYSNPNAPSGLSLHAFVRGPLGS